VKFLITDEALQYHMNYFVTYGYREGAKKMGLTIPAFRYRISVAMHKGIEGTRMDVDDAPVIGRTTTEFCDSHAPLIAVTDKVRNALTRLGDRWLYQDEFRKAAGVTNDELEEVAMTFYSHIVSTKTRVIWVGNIVKATEFRAMVST
jgi:hypothetical protein